MEVKMKKVIAYLLIAAFEAFCLYCTYLMFFDWDKTYDILGPSAMILGLFMGLGIAGLLIGLYLVIEWLLEDDY